ncbi:unnamed protein product, partial [Oppiella nova]
MRLLYTLLAICVFVVSIVSGQWLYGRGGYGRGYGGGYGGYGGRSGMGFSGNGGIGIRQSGATLGNLGGIGGYYG